MNNFKLSQEDKIAPGFTTPDNYFANFSTTLLQQLPQQKVRVLPLYKSKPVWLSIAAAFIILLTLGLFFTTTTYTAQPDDTAIENYLVYNTNVNSYDLIEHLDEQDIEELEASITLNDEALNDYLTEDDIYFIK